MIIVIWHDAISLECYRKDWKNNIKIYVYYYNLRLRVRLKKKSCIGLIQENLIEFWAQSVYLIYTRLMVYTTLNLVYSKKYIYYMLLTCSITLLF